MRPLEHRRGAFTELRRRAEAIVSEGPHNDNAVDPTAIRRLLHELMVYQEELEIQNEQLREAQADLEESRNRYLELFEVAPVGYFEVATSGQIIDANAASARLLGCDLTQVRGRPLSVFVPRGAVGLLLDQRRQAMQSRVSDTREIQLNRPTGQPIHVLFTTVRLGTGIQSTFLCAFVDITQRKDAESGLGRLAEQLEAANIRLRELAMHDALTGLFNRRGFEAALMTEVERADRNAAPLCAILIDCDNFKQVNDNLGHAAGDVVLATVARRLRETLRPSDILARVGGDEFLCLLPGASAAQATHVAERLRLSVCSTPIALSHGPIQLTLSLAVTPLDTPVNSVEEVLALNRDALKQSKGMGKNRTSIAGHPAVDTSTDNPLTERRRFTQAVQHDNFFHAACHPIVDAMHNTVVGYEFLSRGPRGPYHRPVDFFRIAMEESLLTTVDVRCFRVCAAASSEIDPLLWRHVNIYPSTLLNMPEETLARLLPDARPGTLCVELSEQQMLGDAACMRHHVEKLRAAGARIAIDDVGFGRSSLESLILLEPEVVKIDRKHVAGVGNDLGKRRSLQRIINAATSLGATIVAEGVESLDDLEVIRELGVRYAQGFLWGRPTTSAIPPQLNAPSEEKRAVLD